MKELVRVRVKYVSRQQCCKTHKRPLPLPITVYQHNKHLGLAPCVVLIADAKESSIQRSSVKGGSGLSCGGNRRAPSAVTSECAVLESLKLKTYKIADTSYSHFGCL